jgi:hypothetical protein
VLVTVKETSYGSGYSDAELLDPEVLDPEVLDPVVLDPEVLDPEVLDPEVLDPEVLDPEVLDPEVLDPEVLELGQSKHCACVHPFEPTVYEIPQRQFEGRVIGGQELLELACEELLELACAELLEPLDSLELLELKHAPVVLHVVCPSTMPKLLLALLKVASPPTTPVEVSSELFVLVPLNVALPETTPKLEE